MFGDFLVSAARWDVYGICVHSLLTARTAATKSVPDIGGKWHRGESSEVACTGRVQACRELAIRSLEQDGVQVCQLDVWWRGIVNGSLRGGCEFDLELLDPRDEVDRALGVPAPIG